jgi:hypothetical protein
MTAQPLDKVFLVGAGAGDPELLTLTGKRCLEARRDSLRQVGEPRGIRVR